MVEDKYPLPYEHELQYPVKWGKDETITKITFHRRLKVADLKGCQMNLAVNDMIRLIAKCTGTVTAFIEELDTSDYLELVEVLQYFLNNGRKTGEEE